MLDNNSFYHYVICLIFLFVVIEQLVRGRQHSIPHQPLHLVHPASGQSRWLCLQLDNGQFWGSYGNYVPLNILTQTSPGTTLVVYNLILLNRWYYSHWEWNVYLTVSSLNLPLSFSSTTSRELLSQFSTCSGWKWLEVSSKWKKYIVIIKQFHEHFRSKTCRF